VTVTPVTVRVPAKVNLQLAVGPLRADGYHELVTVFHAVSLFDEVTVRPADRTSVRVSGTDAAAVPAGRANLAVRAAAALARAARPRGASSAVAIEIRKRIPVAAGLAGGSADAAAALVACNELWQAGLSAAELSAVAAGVGSDVAFALLGGTAVGRGRGEQLTVALAAGTYHWVLAFSPGGLSTPEVYAACDRLRAARAVGVAAGPGRARPPGLGAALGASPVASSAGGRAVDPVAGSSGEGAAGVPEPRLSTELMVALRSADPAAVGPLLSNDLQPAALSLRPELRRTLSAGRELGAIGAMVSGSGPTCAFLAADARHARDLAVSLTGAGVCRGVAGCHGPVHGATVIPAGEHG
jgi:4-diphosphocytidyl-2-C-methyl-D-erythritol kinase